MPDGELKPANEKLVLVIEDDDSTRELMEKILKLEGFRIDTARDGQEGIDKAREIKPDLIMLDLRLPKYQGGEIVRMLQEGATSGIPVVIVTGHAGNQANSDLLRREPNVKGYFEKPVNPMALGMNLHMLLKTRPPTSGKASAW